jgi:hypothetical protein
MRVALLFCLLLATSSPCGADRPDDPDPESRGVTESALEGNDPERGIAEEALDGEEHPATLEREDLCDWELEDRELQEQSQEVFRSWSCHTFRWFDSWWGDTHDFPEEQVSGWATMGLDYSQFDGIDGRLRLKVRSPLPNMSSRWSLIVGRVDDEAFVSDTQPTDSTFYNPGIISRGEEDSWLLGLGHRRGRRDKGWDWSVGVRLRNPIEPYAKLAWIYRKQFTENADMRFRQTFFWRSEEGFGTTSRADTAWVVNPKNVMRWESIIRFSEEIDGMEWYAGQTWYRLLENGSHYSLLAFARGETDAPVSLKDTGFEFLWRFPFTRDYIHLSMGPSLTWPRKKPEQKREASLGFGVWIELEFGDWRY